MGSPGVLGGVASAFDLLGQPGANNTTGSRWAQWLAPAHFGQYMSKTRRMTAAEIIAGRGCIEAGGARSSAAMERNASIGVAERRGKA